MTQQSQLLELLRSLPFLTDQPDEILAELAETSQLLRYRLGQPISRLDQAPEHLLLLIRGTVRQVVMADRLPLGLATIQRHEVGAVIAWTPLSCGRCWETLIASTDLVALAVPLSAMQAAMAKSPSLARRVQHSVNPGELFSVLDAYLQSFPRLLSKEVVEAAKSLAGDVKVASLSTLDWQKLGPDGLRRQLPQDYIWLVSSGPLALGSGPDDLLPDGDSTLGVSRIRLLGIGKQSLSDLLEPPLAPDSLQQQDNEPTLLHNWQQNELLQNNRNRPLDLDAEAGSQEFESIREAPDLPSSVPEEISDLDHLPLTAFPFHEGVGPLESPVSAFRMLADHLGLPFRRELFRRVFGDQVKRHGEASLALCGAVAESIGLRTQLIETDIKSISRLEPPLLLRWGNGVALIYCFRKKKLVVGIPAVGVQELSLEELKEQWGSEGEVLTLKADSLTPKRKFGFGWFLPSLRQHRSVLIEVLLASFFVQLFGLVNPLLIQQVIDKAIINSSPDALGVLGLLLVVFALFEGLLLCLRTFLFVDTTNRIDLSLGTLIIDHLLRLPMSYFDRRPVGEVASRIGELEKVRSFLTGTALTAILDAVFSLLYIVVMLIYSWQLTILTLAVIPVLMALTFAVAPMVRSQIQNRAVSSARTQSHLVEVLSSMMTVKAQNIELRSRWKWQDLYTDYVAEGFDNTLLSTTAGSINGFLNKLSSLLVIWGGAYLVLQGDLSLGGLIAFRIIAGYVTGPLLRMSSIWQNVQETALSLERLSDVIDHPQEAPEDNSRRINMAPVDGNIEFRNIEFRYKASSPLLLKGVNLEIKAGSFVGIVGLSGSGKSTLTKLVSRLYEAEKGTVLVDGIDISKVELYSLRRQLGIVPQDTVLFEGSVEENIALTNPEASTEEIVEAAKIACAHDFIMGLPAGYSQQVGERGSGLSGGQRQRIAIARTILQKPRLLIMDEATSALDYQTERVVSENLMRSLRGRTVLFITHRLASISNADQIVVMGDGVVVETGTHQELMDSRGVYYALYRQQGRSSSSSSHAPDVATAALSLAVPRSSL